MRIVCAYALAAAAIGCGGPDRIDSCADSLMGQWSATEGETSPSGEPLGFDISEQDGARIAIHAMFDDSVPPDGSDKMATEIIYAPGSFGLGRSGPILLGKHVQRRTKAGKVCVIRVDARAEGCKGRELKLAWQVVDTLDWTDCSVTVEPTWRSVRLRRR